MASINHSTSSSKKRHVSFNHFLASKNLSIFRCKSPNIDNPNPVVSSSLPVCLENGWLKEHLPQPLSLDLQLFKDILIDNDEPSAPNDHGTRSK
ncbi:unnamed protein product [Adineta ricciae]|uniref:Uncharacterized protein n=2 Tax=Adineta ricciae TaxID=249248 RepID=A0A814RU75_ADIRI|nr:unnamed protein product [Adineta ricciae]